MLISESINSAWLLSCYGDEILVIEHPNEYVEIDRIAEIIYQYGTDNEKQKAKTFKHTKNSNIGKELIDIYHQRWCQVREWNDYNYALEMSNYYGNIDYETVQTRIYKSYFFNYIFKLILLLNILYGKNGN